MATINSLVQRLKAAGVPPRPLTPEEQREIGDGSRHQWTPWFGAPSHAELPRHLTQPGKLAALQGFLLAFPMGSIGDRLWMRNQSKLQIAGLAALYALIVGTTYVGYTRRNQGLSEAMALLPPGATLDDLKAAAQAVPPSA